jgi:hypothetical protein
MASEYDAMLAAEAGNEYDAMLSGEKAAQQGNLNAALAGNPDEYAKAVKLARATGAPPAAVAGVLPEVERRVRLNEYDAMLANAPTLAGQYAASTDFARVAADDTGVLAKLEAGVVGAARYVTSADDRGGLLRDLYAGGYLRSSAATAGLFRAGSESTAWAAEKMFPWLRYAEDQGVLGGNPYRRLAEGFAQISRQSEAEAKRIAPPQEGVLASGVSSGVQSTGQNLKYLPLVMLGPAGAAAALAGMVGESGGQSYQQAREQGLGPAQALPFAASQAAIEYATERLPMGALVRDLKAGSTLSKMIMRQAATEIPGEQIATVLQDMNEWAVLPQNAGKPFSTYLADRPSAAAKTLIATVVGVGAQSGVMKAIQTAADSALGVERQAQAAQDTATKVEALAATAAESKLRERDPISFRDFVQRLAESSGAKEAPTDLYIDAHALANTLNQAGIGLAQLAEVAPTVASQMKPEGLVPGSDIRLPVAELLAAAPEVTAPLLEHLRDAPDSMSKAEADAFLLNQGEVLRQEVERTITAGAVQDQEQQSSGAVREHFAQQLTAAGRFTDTVNQAYATMLGSFYESQSARASMTPDEMLQRYQLGIASTTSASARKLSQRKGGKGPRAQLSFGQDITQSRSVISLLKGADLSSLLHEGGHFFLEVQSDLAARIRGRQMDGDTITDGEQQILADMDTLLDWLGVKGTPQTSAHAEWLATDLERKRSAHEQFARSFERYLMEGQAPSIELQGIFQRFRAWLLSVYKTIAGLNSNLTDDVRRVMDRMLASDEAIRAAEAARNLGPLFQSAEQAGMTGEEYAAYQALNRSATDEATAQLAGRMVSDMRWLGRAKDKALRRAQREADQLRREVQNEVTREVMAEPVYQAWQFLTGREERIAPGTVPAEQVDTARSSARLRSSRVKQLDAGAYATLSARHMTAEETGMDPDVVSEMFPGFTSGDQLVKALALAEPPQAVIQALTDQRMLERYGDISSPQALERAAEAAIANDVRARVVATELKATMRATNTRQGSVDVMARAAKDFAAQVIARQKIKDLRPKQYGAAAARSARLAMQSLGKVEEVAEHKRNELVNLQASRAAADAQGEVERGAKYLDRVQKANLPAEYREQIDQILERFDIKLRTTQKEIARRKSLAQWIESQREIGVDPDVPDYLLNEATRVSVKDLTVEEFRGLIDTVKQIEHLGRLKSKLLTSKDQRDFDAVRTDLVASIEANARGRKADTRTPTTNTGRWFSAVKSFGAAHIKAATWARILDGGKDGGPMWERFIRPANAAGDQETRMRAEATRRLSEILAPIMKAGKLGGKGRYFSSVGKSFNREAVLAIALNTGNASNLQRLLDGEGWTPNQLQPILDSVTAQEWAAVQQVWDYFESFRPLIGAKELRVSGREPEWIEPTPVQTATAGTLRGGYYPIKYDPAASVRAEEHADAEAAREQLKGAYGAATTRRSFTKARAEEVRGRPLLYTLQGMYGGVNDVIHDLAWHEWLIDANRLLRSQTIDDAMRTAYGPQVVRQFKTWRDAVAAGDAAAQEAVDSALSRLRQGVSIAGLGFNVMSAAMQPLGFTQSIVRVGAGWVGKGVLQYVGAPIAKTREVNGKSDFMASRARTRFRELNELRNRVQGQTAARERLNASAYVLMMRFQQAVDVPTWLGAYEKAVAGGNAEERAVALADQAVIDAQGGGQMKDLSAIERGGPGQKLFTVFYSFMNTALNLGVAQGMTNTRAAKTAADMALLFVVPAVLGELLKDALTPGDAGGDDWDQLVKKLLGAQLGFLLGLIVVGREFADAAKTAAGLSDYSRDYQGPAGLRFIADSASFAKQASQGEFDDAFRKSAVNVVGSLLGLPAAQINRTITGAQALNEGKTENPAALLLGHQEPR